MIRPIPIQIQSVAEHGALVKMAAREYRSPDEQAAWLVVDGLRRAGYLPDAVRDAQAMAGARAEHGAMPAGSPGGVG